MTVRLISDKELARVDRGELAIVDAGVLLGLSERHVFRLLDRLRVDGVAGLASRRRGRPSNRRLRDELRIAAIALVRRSLAREDGHLKDPVRLHPLVACSALLAH